MKKILLMSLIFLQGCILGVSTDDTSAVEQLIEPPNIRSAPAEMSQQGTQMNKNIFEQEQWQLVSYLSSQGIQAVIPRNLATIQFVDQKISGSTGCNRYFASCQLMGTNTLKISQSGLTMMACPESIAKQEQQFLKNLLDINFYLFQGEQLQLLDTQNQVLLIFQKQLDVGLEKTVWQMTGLNNAKGGVVSNGNSNKAILQFIDGKLTGTSGCNRLSAYYQVNGEAIKIAAVSMTRKYCGSKSLMSQEQQLSNALSQVSHYQIRNNQLRLINAKGALMVSFKQQE